jgi:hypothetical protein
VFAPLPVGFSVSEAKSAFSGLLPLPVPFVSGAVDVGLGPEAASVSYYKHPIAAGRQYICRHLRLLALHRLKLPAAAAAAATPRTRNLQLTPRRKIGKPLGRPAVGLELLVVDSVAMAHRTQAIRAFYDFELALSDGFLDQMNLLNFRERHHQNNVVLVREFSDIRPLK